MKQSRFMSLVESVSNILVGYALAVITQIVIFPWWGIQVRFWDHIAIGLIFMLVATIRHYTLRRIFEHIRMR